MVNYLIPSVVLLFFGCTTDFSANHVETDIKANQQSVIKTSIIQDTVYVRKWLTKVIKDYINNDDSNVSLERLRTSLTEDYYNYKLDNITLEYSEMTEEAFYQKWKTKYDIRYVGTGGFFTSVMDNGNVDIPVCAHLKSLGDTAQIFHAVLRDLRWKIDYVMDITVVMKDNQVLIDDVRQYQ